MILVRFVYLLGLSSGFFPKPLPLRLFHQRGMRRGSISIFDVNDFFRKYHARDLLPPFRLDSLYRTAISFNIFVFCWVTKASRIDKPRALWFAVKGKEYLDEKEVSGDIANEMIYGLCRNGMGSQIVVTANE